MYDDSSKVSCREREIKDRERGARREITVFARSADYILIHICRSIDR